MVMEVLNSVKEQETMEPSEKIIINDHFYDKDSVTKHESSRKIKELLCFTMYFALIVGLCCSTLFFAIRSCNYMEKYNALAARSSGCQYNRVSDQDWKELVDSIAMKCTGRLNFGDSFSARNNVDETVHPLQTSENIINRKCVKELIVALNGTRY